MSLIARNPLATILLAILLMPLSQWIPWPPLQWFGILIAMTAPYWAMAGIIAMVWGFARGPRLVWVLGVLMVLRFAALLVPSFFAGLGGTFSYHGTSYTFVNLNVHRDLAPVEHLAQAHGDATFITMSEVPGELSESELRALFPTHNHVVTAPYAGQFNARPLQIVLLSQLELNNIEIDHVKTLLRRPVILAHIENLRIMTAHSIAPLAPTMVSARNDMTQKIVARMDEVETAIFVGDMNLTPFESIWPHDLSIDVPLFYTFSDLGGALRLPIDHFLTRGSIEEVIVGVGMNLGSDHLPLIGTFSLHHEDDDGI